jgi:hypothetical protein
MPTAKPPVAHYDRCTLQPIDIIEATFTPEEYRGHLKACIIKYLFRYQHKGTPLEDLRKAANYLEWLLEHETNGPSE